MDRPGVSAHPLPAFSRARLNSNPSPLQPLLRNWPSVYKSAGRLEQAISLISLLVPVHPTQRQILGSNRWHRGWLGLEGKAQPALSAGHWLKGRKKRGLSRAKPLRACKRGRGRGPKHTHKD